MNQLLFKRINWNSILFILEVFLQINHQIPWMPLNYLPAQLIYLYLFLILQNQMDHPSFLVLLITEQIRVINKLVASSVGGRTHFAAMVIAFPFPYSLAWVQMENFIRVHLHSKTMVKIHYYHISLIVLLIATMSIGQVPKMLNLLIRYYHFWY